MNKSHVPVMAYFASNNNIHKHMQTKRWASSLFKVNEENRTRFNTITATNT